MRKESRDDLIEIISKLVSDQGILVDRFQSIDKPEPPYVVCGNCRSSLAPYKLNKSDGVFNYCPHCGEKIKYDKYAIEIIESTGYLEKGISKQR